MLILDHSEAHKFVREQRKIGNDVRWENYDMVFWKPTHHGFTSTNGRFNRKTGRWGIDTRITVDSDGKWRVNKRHVKSA